MSSTTTGTAESRLGTYLWAGLAGYVITTDVYAAASGRETLTSAFAKGIHHPLHRPWVVVLWAYITIHLFNLLPQRWDPLYHIGLGAPRDRTFESSKG